MMPGGSCFFLSPCPSLSSFGFISRILTFDAGRLRPGRKGNFQDLFVQVIRHASSVTKKVFSSSSSYWLYSSGQSKSVGGLMKRGVNVVYGTASSLLVALVFISRAWASIPFSWRYGVAYVSVRDGVQQKKKRVED
jgi:hypothetical protein